MTTIKTIVCYCMRGIWIASSSMASTAATVIVVGLKYYNIYLPRVCMLIDRCQGATSKSGLGVRKWRGDALLLIARWNICYYMESVQLVLYGGISRLPPISTFNYIFFVNCCMTGLAPPPPLDDTVKMTGLTLN